MTRQIALLRGINVGKNKRIAMADLRELLGSLGYDDVKTHLMSGNAVVTTTKTVKAVEQELVQAIDTSGPTTLMGHAAAAVLPG